MVAKIKFSIEIIVEILVRKYLSGAIMITPGSIHFQKYRVVPYCLTLFSSGISPAPGVHRQETRNQGCFRYRAITND
jgi:hypothetical protein